MFYPSTLSSMPWIHIGMILPSEEKWIIAREGRFLVLGKVVSLVRRENNPGQDQGAEYQLGEL